MTALATTNGHSGAISDSFSSSRHEYVVPDVARDIWTALTENETATVAVFDAAGAFRSMSRKLAAEINARPDEAVGISLAKFLPAPAARERLEVIARCAATGQTIVMLGVLGGIIRRTTFMPLRTGVGGASAERLVLMLCKPLHETIGAIGSVTSALARGASELDGLAMLPENTLWQATSEGVTITCAPDMGPLVSLTDRELEVLRLIGFGLSTEEIAVRLHRSRKTVEWHRASLGDKLRASNRVILARIAIEAGLVLIDEQTFTRLRDVLPRDRSNLVPQ